MKYAHLKDKPDNVFLPTPFSNTWQTSYLGRGDTVGYAQGGEIKAFWKAVNFVTSIFHYYRIVGKYKLFSLKLKLFFFIYA